MAIKYDGTISLGSVLSMGTVLVTVTLAYGAIRGDQAALRQRVEVAEISSVNREARLRAVEIQQAGQTSDLRAIQTGIAEIKTLLSNLDERQRTRTFSVP